MPFTQSAQDTAATIQEVPGVKTVYETADTQILDDASFIGKLSALMAIRTTYNVANARFHGRFETLEPGSFAYALVLPRLDGSTAASQAAPKAEQPDGKLGANTARDHGESEYSTG
jgi:hypothetical protein